MASDNLQNQKLKVVAFDLMYQNPFEFCRYLNNHVRYSISNECCIASRLRIEVLLLRPLGVTATSNFEKGMSNFRYLM